VVARSPVQEIVPASVQRDLSKVPATLTWPGATRFWTVALLTGVTAGAGAILLTRLLELVQRLTWGGDGRAILDAASHATPLRHVVALLGAGVVTGLGQLFLVRLTSGNSIDITAAIWFSAGRLPKVRTLGSATLSEVIVGMGASLGREGGPKQAASVAANFYSDLAGLSDEQRRLLVACGAGAGLAAAYGVPLGGALFALEVLRGTLALRLILPAMFTATIAAAISWIGLPNVATYHFPSFSNSLLSILLALGIAPFAGLASVGYVRAVAWADRHKPTGKSRLVAPVLVLGTLGLVSIPFPQLLGNGRDISQLLFNGALTSPLLALALLLLKPAATISCVRSGAPGGLFTPSLTFGALLGAMFGLLASRVSPGIPTGLAAFLGAAGVLAATTQGPISATVLMLELSNRDRSLIAPLLLVVIGATIVSRTIEARSIYDARLDDAQVAERLAGRNQSSDPAQKH
jgi:CIC family chloride channel protein